MRAGRGVVMVRAGVAPGACQLCIVRGAFLGHGQDVVGFAYGDKTRRGGGVLRVVVGMVLLGEGVELAFDVGGGGRGAELEEALLDAAWAELQEVGYPAFTYEGVAQRAGTSKPVLYRMAYGTDVLVHGDPAEAEAEVEAETEAAAHTDTITRREV